MTDQHRIAVAKNGACDAEEYIEAFGVAPWAQYVVRNAWLSFSKAHNISERAEGNVMVSNNDEYCQNCGRLESEHYTWFRYCEGAPSRNPATFTAKNRTEEVK